MTAAEDPNVQRRKLGVALRRSREAAQLTQREVAEALDWSLSKVIRIETGAHGTSMTDLRAMLDLFEVTDPDVVATLMAVARGSRGQPWWHEYRDIVSPQFARYMGYEGATTSFRIFHPLLVPGLLHTEGYATGLLGAHPETERAQRIVKLRMERQRRLLAQGGNKFTFILDEEALYRWIGGARVMRHQLERLLDVSSHPNASVRIVPFSAGAHPGLRGPFVILRLRETDDDVLFLESANGDQLIRDEPEVIARYSTYFERLGELALPAEQGKDLLKEQISHLYEADESAADGTEGR
jgi:transcriptional regulator with XRE-family HTH domain